MSGMVSGFAVRVRVSVRVRNWFWLVFGFVSGACPVCLGVRVGFVSGARLVSFWVRVGLVFGAYLFRFYSYPTWYVSKNIWI